MTHEQFDAWVKGLWHSDKETFDSLNLSQRKLMETAFVDGLNIGKEIGFDTGFDDGYESARVSG